MNLERIFTAGAFVLVGAALVLGFLFIGTPGHARQLAMDRKRLEDLHDIALAVRRNYGPRSPLPRRMPAGVKAIDPFTQRPYEYAKLDAQDFDLCAVFSAPAPAVDDDRPPQLWAGDWSHPAGRVCFTFDVTDESETPSGHTPK